MNYPLQLQRFSYHGMSVDFFVPDATAVQAAYQQGGISFPYWSQVWPAALALGQFLRRNEAYTKDKTVLELGAGLGLPSLVAAKNAAAVLCTDIAPEAVAIVRRSAQHNGYKNFQANVLDWQQIPVRHRTDVLLLSDVNYAPGSFAFLQQLVQAFLKAGTVILLSTPQRLVAKAFVAPLLSSCTYQEEIAVEHKGQTALTTVLVLQA